MTQPDALQDDTAEMPDAFDYTPMMRYHADATSIILPLMPLNFISAPAYASQLALAATRYITLILHARHETPALPSPRSATAHF